MYSLNEVTLCGRLGADPEPKYTQDGTPVASLRLATDESYTPKDGNKVEKTEWHNLVAWRKTAELLAQLCSKGMEILVKGKLQTRSWEKDGQKHYTTEILVSDFKVFGKKEEKKEKSEPTPPPPPEEDDSLPF